jgi:hypothetical protein
LIISEIIGGLGNQMFQYAAARALSLRKNQPLVLDISRFTGYALHQGFELQRVFACPAKITSSSDTLRVLGWQSPRVVRKVLSKSIFASLRRPEYVIEPHFQYWSNIDLIPLNCYLSGYWQSEKYFADAIHTIRTEFAFKQPMSAVNAETSDVIEKTNSVSLHVRRGDYTKYTKTTAVHGLCSVDYYKAAIEYVSEHVENPCLYIFSDDLEWVRGNLPTNLPCKYIDHNQGRESFNDMRLMSLCKHHIVANSSFSWWGAWLNPAPRKLVVAPKKWFATQTDTRDLIPVSWQTL